MTRAIDVYCHCGARKYRPLADVLEALDGAGVNRAVLVQHLGEFDNDYIGEAVRRHPNRFTGVCLIDHRAPRAPENLARCKESGEFEGVRLRIQDLPDATDLFHAAVDLDLNIVLCTIGGLHPYLTELQRALDIHPDARLTLTHWGWPRVDEGPAFTDYQRVLSLAEYTGVYLQLSGLSMYSSDYLDIFRRAAELAWNAFGPRRLLWGSNFPVSGKDTPGYAGELAPYRSGAFPFPRENLPAILHDNAERLWFRGHQREHSSTGDATGRPPASKGRKHESRR